MDVGPERPDKFRPEMFDDIPGEPAACHCRRMFIVFLKHLDQVAFDLFYKIFPAEPAKKPE
jgi:hypothetical protein